MKRSLLILSFLATAFLACQKENLNDDAFRKELDLGKTTTATVTGIVVDESDNPVAGALVSLGDQSGQTDENGVFRFEKAKVTENLAHISVQKEGFFPGSRSFLPRYDNNPEIRIKLLEKTLAGSIQASSGGIAALGNKLSASFPAGAFVQTNGQAYTGTVEVFAAYIDPTAPDLGQRMPGNLLGFSDEDGVSTLASFGMIAVELAGEQGQTLQLAPGKPATVEISVPPSLLSNAPATIPLWHFDETTGIWMEEGEAVLENGRYVGQVAHFSFWNLDVPYPLVFMDGSVFLDSASNPVEGLLVHFSVVGSASTGFGYSDENGQFSGYIPADETLLLELIDNCGSVVYSETIGPFSSSVTLDPIILASASLTYTPVEISGSLTGCDTLPVTDGYVIVQSGQNTAIFEVDPATGEFSGTFQACDSSDFILTGVDGNTLQQSEELAFSPAPTVNTGSISTCFVELDEYVQMTLDGVDYLFTNYVSLKDTIPGAGFILVAQGNVFTQKIALITSSNGVGSYPALEFGFGFGNYAMDPENILVTVTEFGPTPGDLVRGSFEGTFINVEGYSHTVSGEFKAIRE